VSGDDAERDDETSLRVRRALEGDGPSLEWLVEHFSPLLACQARYRLSRHLRGIYDPEDLVQQVWMTCLPKLGRIHPREGRFTPVLLSFLGTTLLRTYHHLVEKHIAGKPRRVDFPGSERGDSDLLAQLPDSVTGGFTRALQREGRARVEEGLRVLSDEQREVFILRAMEEMPYRLAAQKLGVTDEVLRSRDRRAISELRRTLPPSIAGELNED